MAEDDHAHEADTSRSAGGLSRRTVLKGGAVVGAALWASPAVETLVDANPVAGASENSVGSSAAGGLRAFAQAAAASGAAQSCTPPWSGAPMIVTPACTDPSYNTPHVDVDEMRTTPVPHRYVNGGFEGTNGRFSFYFPPANQYQGRFFQFTYPLVGPIFASLGLPTNEDDIDANIEFSLASGGYDVHTNVGGADASMSVQDAEIAHKDPTIGGYRVNAAAAKFSRVLAEEMYGPHRPYGYLYGASGGAYQTVSSMENTVGVWDGSVPEVYGSPNSIPSNFTIEIYALRILAGVFPQIVDALNPGGSGNPYASLNSQQQAALREATLLGFPLRGWWDYETLTAGTFLLLLTGAYVPILDPTYVDDFWTKPGYEGTDPTSSVGSLRIQFDTTVVSVTPTQFVLASVPAGDLTGAYLVFTSGAATGQLVPVGGASGNTVSVGVGADPTVVSEVKAGDQVRIDNSWFLALQTYHRHQVPPPDMNLYAWDQYRNPDGTPKYPQRDVLVGPIGALNGGGSLPTGQFHGKMIQLGSTMDDSAFPWSSDWYKQLAQGASRGTLAKNYRLWFTDNADHTEPPNTAAQAVTVGYMGVVQQALRDLAAWVEQGVAPPASTNYQMVDTQVQLPPSARQRRGVQPVLTLLADGGARAEAGVGQTVTFTADAEVPPGAGKIVAAQWDFLGAGTYPVNAKVTIGPTVHLEATYSYPSAGTYFPVLRVTSQRDGDPNTPYGRIQNLARARVVVH